MVHTQLSLPDNLDQRIASLASSVGKKKEEVIIEALKAYVGEPLSIEETLALRQRAFGMWKDRTDLPDFDALRKTMDRKLNWDNDH